MDIKDIFIAKARKYNQYCKGDTCVSGRKCLHCVRWRFSFPYTCNNYNMHGNLAEDCINYDEDFKCKVD
jgi:hypothetical protein